MSALFVSFSLGSNNGQVRYGSHLVPVPGPAMIALSEEGIAYLRSVVETEYGVARPVVSYDILPEASDHPSEGPLYGYAYTAAFEYSRPMNAIAGGTVLFPDPILTLDGLRAAEEFARKHAEGIPPSACHFTMLKPIAPNVTVKN